MTAAVITLSIALAAALGALAFVVYKLTRVMPDLVEAGKLRIAAEDLADDYRHERDDALLRLKEASEREAAAIVRLKLAEKRANEASEEATRHVVERVRNARIADAGRIVDDLLSAPLPGTTAARDATTTGDRPAAAGVQPAIAAGPDVARRDSGPVKP